MAEGVTETGTWHQTPEFQRYWKHYADMQEWYAREVKPSQAQEAANLRTFMEWCRSMHAYHKQHADYMYQHYLYYSQLSAGQPRGSSTPGGMSSTVSVSSTTSRPGNPTPQSAKRVATTKTMSRQSAANRRRQQRREKSRSRRKRQRRKLMRASSSIPCQVEVRVQGDLETQDDIDIETDTSHDKYEFEMEITDDMLEFFTHSAKHRKERDTMKKEEAENQEEQYINLADAYSTQKRSKSAPTEQPGRRRIEEMRELYGEGAAMIHGMETSMQLTFDRNCDIKDPKLWPYLPLNIKFTS